MTTLLLRLARLLQAPEWQEAWDNDGGINRVALFDTMANTPPRIIDNLVAPLAINGEYDEIVQLRDDVFADADGDEFFFWDPTNGRNRVAFV